MGGGADLYLHKLGVTHDRNVGRLAQCGITVCVDIKIKRHEARGFFFMPYLSVLCLRWPDESFLSLYIRSYYFFTISYYCWLVKSFPWRRACFCWYGTPLWALLNDWCVTSTYCFSKIIGPCLRSAARLENQPDGFVLLRRCDSRSRQFSFADLFYGTSGKLSCSSLRHTFFSGRLCVCVLSFLSPSYSSFTWLKMFHLTARRRGTFLLLCKSGCMTFPLWNKQNWPHLNKCSFHFLMVSKCANKSGEENLKRQTTTNSLVHHKNYNHL